MRCKRDPRPRQRLITDLARAQHGVVGRRQLLRSGLEVDFLWSAARLVVETDGYEFHSTPWAIKRDRRRELELGRAGYEVVRLTCRQVAETPAEIAASLRRKLGA